ncbi:MAG: AMP-binding protein [Leadbetterella sp.]
MLLERFDHIEPDKIALIYKDYRLSYGTLKTIATEKANQFAHIQEEIILNKSSELDNFLDLLAAMYAGKRVIYGGGRLHDTLKETYSTKGYVFSDDLIIQKNNAESNKAKITTSTHFLGVLSSGTTGESKVIWKDYQSWFSAFPHMSSVFGISSTDIVFVLDALAYSANLNTLLHGIWQGCTVVLESLQNATNWSKTIENNNVSSIFLVPSHYELLASNGIQNTNLGSLISAGEKLPVDLAAKLMGLYPNAILTEYYGAAELGHISYIQNQDILNHPQSVGKAFPQVKISVQENKICVDSPYISPEYRNQNTVNDLGEVDENGFLIVLGREGRMFNRRGLNIFAQEIEQASLIHPFVKNALVLPHPEIHHKIVLWAEVSQAMTSKVLHRHLLQNLPSAKLPNFIYILENFPRNIAGKIDISALRKTPEEIEIL